MNSLVKLPSALRRRPFLRAWTLLTTTRTCLLLVFVATCTVARPHQDFPVAAEEYHYVFRADGTYSFSYDTGEGKHQSFRLEARDAKGRVSGRFGYIDPDGALRITMYQADATGYRANMVIYRKVTFAPPQPLLVGPLPRSVSFKATGEPRRKSPPGEPAAPVGPVTFLSPEDAPILVIGPLPKPLQPPRGEDDSDSGPLSVSLSAPEKDFLVESSGIPDVPQGPPPNDIPNSVLATILQDNFQKIFRGTLPAILMNSEGGGSVRISLNVLEEGEVEGQQPASSEDDLVKISQELLRGPEVRLGTTNKAPEKDVLPFSVFQRNRTRSDVVNGAPFLDILNSSLSFRPNNSRTDLNRTFALVRDATDSPNQNRSREKQNNSFHSQLNTSASLASSSGVGNKTITLSPPVLSTKDSKQDSAKYDAPRASSFPVSINGATAPPLTYLPAYSMKVPRQSIYIGSLPSY
ncbi:uncharacterized protein [Palaemon carinicauda]|uniref:uncharacterized protein n=1 Tax=Palaemon carinicauda TaxID=392227 RepID=UPI0035B69FE3